MHQKIKDIKEIIKISNLLKERCKKVILCHGFFDILHKGHIYFLSESKKRGDVLIVGVDHDLNAKRIKGITRPINDHDSRMYVLANLETVDYVFLIPELKESNEDTFFRKLYQSIKPYAVTSSLKAGKHGISKKQRSKEAGIIFIDISGFICDKNTTKLAKIFGFE